MTKDTPIDMVLHCPACGAQHIDKADEFKPTGQCSCAGPYECEECMSNANAFFEWQQEGPWLNPPHRSHLCAECNHIWRPADVPTNGVQAVKTRGEKDTPIEGTRVVTGSGLRLTCNLLHALAQGWPMQRQFMGDPVWYDITLNQALIAITRNQGQYLRVTPVAQNAT